MALMLPFAPGARAVIRDEEWLIRRADPSTDGGWLLTCGGISELVRSQSALFLTHLEGAIKVLDPATTVLVPDSSPTYNATLLYLESQRRRTVPNDERIHLGHRGVMNLVPYQLDPALQALLQPRVRILIVDAVGLDKTLESGVLGTELIQRGRGKRTLVVTQKAMLTHFQKEWRSRFPSRWRGWTLWAWPVCATASRPTTTRSTTLIAASSRLTPSRATLNTVKESRPKCGLTWGTRT